MAWDKLQPTLSTAFSLVPGLIQANWDAIETGAVPCTNLQLLAGGVPGTIAGSGRLYTTGGNAELSFVNGAGTVKQLTDITPTTLAGAGFTAYGIRTPWGIVINWGLGQLSGGTRTVTYAVAHTATPACLITERGSLSPTYPLGVFAESNTSMQVKGNTTALFFFFTIGV